jgi:hypothetical protein
MSDTLRRLYNSVDLFFDRRALTQELRFSQDLGDTNEPKTARYAFQFARQAAVTLDPEASLKLIVSPDGIGADGTSARWEFFFDLPARRAKLECDWFLPWEVETDRFGMAQLEVVARPFPPLSSPLRQMVKDGKLLHRKLIGFWKKEYRRSPELPLPFRDSDEAMAELRRQGLDPAEVEFSLGTDQSPAGKLSWVAQTRDHEFFVDLG